MKDQNKAIAYIRVAKPVQIEDAISGEKQKQQILEATKRLNVEIDEWFLEEGHKPMHFPYQVLDKALEYCQDNPDIKYLFVATPDRLSRSSEVFHYWKVAFERIDVFLKLSDETKPATTIEDSIIEDAYLCMVANHEHEVRLSKIEEDIRNEKVKKV